MGTTTVNCYTGNLSGNSSAINLFVEQEVGGATKLQEYHRMNEVTLVLNEAMSKTALIFHSFHGMI